SSDSLTFQGVNTFEGVVHFSGWIIALSVSCVAGQILTDAVRNSNLCIYVANFANFQGQLIQQAVWESQWYRSELKLKKSILFMLMRSQRDVYLRAGPFGILSLT